MDNLKRIMDKPFMWDLARSTLNLLFGLNRNRVEIPRSWGCLEGSPSIIDIVCGIGQYTEISCGSYLGIDLNEGYINYGRKRHISPNCSFICNNIENLSEEISVFDIDLMIDILHNLPYDDCGTLLNAAAKRSNKYVVSFEPIYTQRRLVGRWFVKQDRGSYIRES